ncbi:MAG: hydrogenase expression/formation protein HypE [Geminicoccaceae bacterium]
MGDDAARVTMAHGAGGRAMRNLIDEVFLNTFSGGTIVEAEDQARLDIDPLRRVGDRLAFTTDSFVVDPIFFPGGDLGKLAVTGTINDLAVGGARPVALSCAVIVEEGFLISDLEKIVRSMHQAADDAGVKIVTGDTKVVQRGAVDKVFINTSGIGVIPEGTELSASRISQGDVILVNSSMGEHGAAIMAARGDLRLETELQTDCRPLYPLVNALLKAAPNTRALRDATRGGVATVLNEFAEAASVGCFIDEACLPLKDEVRGLSEILGLDPLYLANEGLFVAVLPFEEGEAALAALRKEDGGADARIIGEVRTEPKGKLVMTSLFGGDRLVDMLSGDQLPRIC